MDIGDQEQGLLKTGMIETGASAEPFGEIRKDTCPHSDLSTKVELFWVSLFQAVTFVGRALGTLV